MADDNKKWIMLGLALLGVYFIYYAMTAPCMVATVNGLNMGSQMNRLICISSDAKLAIMSLVGSLLIFSAGGRFISEV